MDATSANPTPPESIRARNEARCERLLGKSALLDTSDIDWSAVPDTEVDPAVLECLIYMRDVEGFTTRYLDGLGAHPATLADPMVARFLKVWQAEETEHANALDQFLIAYGDGRGLPLPTMAEPPPFHTSLGERALLAATRPVGHVVSAIHMAWGATNELLTMNGYRLLARQCNHPILADLLGRIAAQEARHYAFYYLQAEWRLADSRLARTVVPRLLRKAWTPVGVGEGFKTADEFDRVLVNLTAVEGDARLASMDETVRRLPGCDGISLFTEAATGSRARVAAMPPITMVGTQERVLVAA